MAKLIRRKYVASADMSTAAAITDAPDTNKKVVVTDLIVSSDTALVFTVQMETSANVLAKFYIAANTTVNLSLAGCLKGDASNKKIYGKADKAGNLAITSIYYSE